MKTLFLEIIVLIASLTVYAAPHPGTGLSVVQRPTWGAATATLGFNLNNLSDDWEFVRTDKTDKFDRKQTAQLQIKQKNAKNNQDTLQISFLSDETKFEMSLENYVKRFLRDYNQYGFDVVASQPATINGEKVIVLDIHQKNKTIRARQIFFNRKNEFVIAQCADRFEAFDQTIQKCNDVVSKFHWNTK